MCIRDRPQGPYHVGGHSLGGWVAYRLAQRLAARGERVTLALFDATSHKHALFPVPRDHAHLLNMVIEGYELESGLDLSAERARMAELTTDEERLQLVRACGERSRRIPPGTDLALVRGRAEVFHAGLLMNDLPAGRLEAPVRLFSAESSQGCLLYTSDAADE